MLELPVYTQAKAYEKITVAGTAIGFTASKYKDYGGFQNQDARCVLITVEGTGGTNDIRWTVDGTTPVGTTTGHLFVAGTNEYLIIKGIGNITNFRAIRDGGTSGTIHCTFFI